MAVSQSITHCGKFATLTNGSQALTLQMSNKCSNCEYWAVGYGAAGTDRERRKLFFRDTLLNNELGMMGRTDRVRLLSIASQTTAGATDGSRPLYGALVDPAAGNSATARTGRESPDILVSSDSDGATIFLQHAGLPKGRTCRCRTKSKDLHE